MLKRHALSKVWGDMPEEQFRELVEDVRANGVRHPITVLRGEVLDGWNRYQAAREAGVQAPEGEYVGDDPGGFVISANAYRRHLTKTQRAGCVLEVRKSAKAGRVASTIGDKLEEEAQRRTIAQLAEEAGTSTSLVSGVKKWEALGHGEDLRSGKETLRSLEQKKRKPKPTDRPVTRMEKLIDENANLTDQVGHLQEQLDRHDEGPPEPSALEEETKTLRTRINALLADLDKERRLHRVARERLKRCMEAQIGGGA